VAGSAEKRVRRQVKAVSTNGRAKIITFLPPISPEVKADTLIYKWDSKVKSVIEDYHLPSNTSGVDMVK
jgi:hypothetical protein